MPVVNETFDVAGHHLAKEHRFIVISQEGSLVLATDKDVNPDVLKNLQFLSGESKLQLESITQHPDRQQDFDDTMAYLDTISDDLIPVEEAMKHL